MGKPKSEKALGFLDSFDAPEENLRQKEVSKSYGTEFAKYAWNASRPPWAEYVINSHGQTGSGSVWDGWDHTTASNITYATPDTYTNTPTSDNMFTFLPFERRYW